MPVVEPSPVEEKKPKKEPDGMKKKKRKREAVGKPKPKSNFQEYLEMEMGGAVSMEEDLEMERKFAKKLKVKKGKLGGPDDGMDELFADLGFGGNFGSDDETKAYDWNVADDTNLDKKKGKKKNKKAKKDDTEMEEPDDRGEENGRKKKKKKMKKAGMETKELDDVGEENGRKRKKKMEDDSEMNEPDDKVLTWMKRMVEQFWNLRMESLMWLNCPQNQKGSMYLRVCVMLPIQNQKKLPRCVAE